MSKQIISVQIQHETIKLGQFLKLVRLIQNGGQAKVFLEQNKVFINDKLAIGRNSKLHINDQVKIGVSFFTILGAKDNSDCNSC